MPEPVSVSLRAVGGCNTGASDSCHMQTESLKIQQLATLYDSTEASTSPEELLLSAAAGCYLITLKTLLENRQIPVVSIELTSEALIHNDGGLRFDSIVHRPTLICEQLVDEAKLRKLAAHAEHACMVSCALRGNVAMSVEPTILIRAAHV